MQLPIEDLYSIYQQHPIIITDSRKISRGCLFFALRGENFDGNAFAHQALMDGAAYAIIDKPEYQSEKCILVKDALTALQELAAFHRSHWKFPVIGITGTNGKTTTKELVHAVLSSHFKAHATSGNLNNHIGVPLTLLSAPESTNIAIIEMGANHPGEIALLSGIANPDFGLITNIGKAHLEGFGGYEGVIKTKSELYQHLEKHKGHAFVNGDNALLIDLSDNIERTLYGSGNAFFSNGSITEIDPCLCLQWNTPNGFLQIQTQLTGEYNFENVMAAISIGSYFGVPEQKIKSAIENYKPTNNRSQTFSSGKNTIILDAYNANPTSMLAAINNFRKLKAEKKMAILGDMLELGSESRKEHDSIVDIIKGSGFDEVILVGPEFSQSGKSYYKTFMNSGEAYLWLKEKDIKGFTILIKGSRGIRMEEVLAAL